MINEIKYKYVPSKSSPTGVVLKQTSMPVASNTVFPKYPVTWVSVPIGTWDIADNYQAPSVKKKDGLDCKKCKEFYPYAESNQEDGTLICYKCRHGY